MPKLKKAVPKFSLVADQDYLATLLALLNLAKTSIDILAYSFAIASTAGKISQAGAPFQIAAELVAIKKRLGKKIRIRLYIEGERETAERNRPTARFLKRAGVEIYYGATHAKGFFVDGEFVLFGSTNLTNQSITKNNEANVLIHSKSLARQFETYFENLWSGGEHGSLHLAEPVFADGDFKDALIAQIDSAKKRIEFSIYFFDQDEIRDALIRAHERGVQVSGFVHQHYSFALSYVRRGFKTVKALKAAGLDDLHFSRPHTFSHSKYLVVDRKRAMLGTANWLDEDVEIHPQLYILIDDAKFAKTLSAHVQDEIKNRSAPRLWSSAPRKVLA